MQADYKKILTQKGLKNTGHRVAILECLATAAQPITVEEIFMYLKKDLLSTSLSTVYRTVEALCEKQLVFKNNLLDDGKARYELAHEAHKHHVSCMECHKIIAIEQCPFETFEQNLKEQMHFQVVGHKFEIYGYCQSCQEQKQAH